jgi:hypothetical protein
VIWQRVAGKLEHELAVNNAAQKKSERHLPESVIVSAEPMLAGTAYWGCAEAEFASYVG